MMGHVAISAPQDDIPVLLDSLVQFKNASANVVPYAQVRTPRQVRAMVQQADILMK
jgi:hypothetical protein